MKLLLLFFAITLLSIESNFAQSVTLSSDFKLELGEPYKVLDASHKRYYFPIEDGRAVSIKRVKERMIVQVFDTKNLTELARNDYREFPPLTTLTQVFKEFFIQTKNKLYHILYVYDSKTKSKRMEARTINTKNAKVSSPKTLFSASKRTYLPYCQLSPDSSKLLVGYSLLPSRKDNFKGSSKEYIYILDPNDLKLQWKKTITIPQLYYNDKPIAGSRVKGVYINRNNTVSILTGNLTNSGDLDLYTISEKEVDTKEKLISLEKDITGFQSPTNRPITYCLSKNQNNLTYLSGQGILSYSLSLKGDFLGSKKYQYPLDFMVKYLKNKEKARILKKEKKGKAEIEDLVLVSFLTQANGGALIVRESQIIEHTTVSTNGSSPPPTYKYNNIILTHLKSDGSVDWVKKIPKRQINKSNRSAPFYIGTQCLLSKDEKNAYIFYLDAPENLEIPAGEIPKEYRSRMMGGFLVLCKVNLENGTYEKHLVADMSDIEGNEAIDIEITNIFPEAESDNIFLMEARFKKKDALIKITMKN